MSAKVPTAPAKAPSARERLLAAADELFYAEGVHVVGIDRVIEQAGVAKATLYTTFGSKDELVRAYLEGRMAARQEWVQDVLARSADPRERLLGLFDALDELFRRPTFRGCAFVNANAEASGSSCAVEVAAQMRGWTRELFTQLAADAGVADPAEVGRDLVLVYDGALAGARMDGADGIAGRARAIAQAILDAAPPAG